MALLNCKHDGPLRGTPTSPVFQDFAMCFCSSLRASRTIPTWVQWVMSLTYTFVTFCYNVLQVLFVIMWYVRTVRHLPLSWSKKTTRAVFVGWQVGLLEFGLEGSVWDVVWGSLSVSSQLVVMRCCLEFLWLVSFNYDCLKDEIRLAAALALGYVGVPTFRNIGLKMLKKTRSVIYSKGKKSVCQ
jgi:hypothetical protein